MKRFEMNQRATPERIASENSTIKAAKYEPYEKVIMKGKYWQAIFADDNGQRRYYLEHLYNGQKTPVIETSPGKGYEMIKKQFADMEARPVEYQGATAPQQTPQAAPPVKSTKELEYERFKKLSEETDAKFKAFEDSIKQRESEVNAELARQRMAELKGSMAALEAQLAALAPEPEGDNDSE